MVIDYSKSSEDIRKENKLRVNNHQELLERQKSIVSTLKHEKKRITCIVCDKKLGDTKFLHRELTLISCDVCGHIQTLIKPPSGYPENEGLGFEKIYPVLSEEGFKNRKERIYRPKLNWIIRCLEKLGSCSEDLKQKKWVDLGCGAGYFLSALHDYGIEDCIGIDSDKALVKEGNKQLARKNCIWDDSKIEQTLNKYKADIYTSFFVLEHIENSYQFFQTLKQLPKGTVFAFSVPVYGFSCLIERTFEDKYARCFDGVVHTQIFTEQSINYALELADFELAAKWVFGQDASDLIRNIITHEGMDVDFFNMYKEKLANLNDALQEVFDRSELADQVHVIAIKR